MKKLILIISIIVFSYIGTAFAAETRYNPYTKRYEFTTRKAVLKYNPYTQKYSYEHPLSILKYNPYEQTYEFVPEEDERENE